MSKVTHIPSSIGSPSHRIDCGYPGIDADQCAARKCCYDDSTENVPFCYQSFLMSERMIKTGQRVALLPKECPAKPSDRQNCGYNRIKPDQCRSLGWGVLHLCLANRSTICLVTKQPVFIILVLTTYCHSNLTASIRKRL